MWTVRTENWWPERRRLVTDRDKELGDPQRELLLKLAKISGIDKKQTDAINTLCEQKEKDVDNNIVQAETQVLKSPVKVKNIFPRPAVSTYKPGSEPQGLNSRSYETYKSPFFSPCAPSELHLINLTACLTFFLGGHLEGIFRILCPHSTHGLLPNEKFGFFPAFPGSKNCITKRSMSQFRKLRAILGPALPLNPMSSNPVILSAKRFLIGPLLPTSISAWPPKQLILSWGQLLAPFPIRSAKWPFQPKSYHTTQI